MRRVLLSLVVASLACGGGPEPVTPPPHVAVKPPAPPPPRARWVFSAPEQEVRARLDLGEHKTLYVGAHGRRELDLGGEIQHAPTLAEEALGGVLRDAKGRYVFVATDGDTYVSNEPLGALERVGPPRREPLASVTTGRASILGIGPGGLMRSTDDGLTWRPVDYPGKSFGRSASVALDTKGNGVLVHVPQRLFVTHDDGATWAPLASPPYGAASALRDGADRVFVLGYHDRGAVLTGDKLALTSEAPGAIFPGQPLHPPRAFTLEEPAQRLPAMPRLPLDLTLGESRTPPLRLLVEGRVVEIARRDQKVEVRSAPLGEPLGAPTSPGDLDEGALDANRVAAYGSELAYVHVDADEELTDLDKTAKAPATTILRSKDYGATWKKEDVLPGVPNQASPAVALGPRGWTYVGPRCPSRYTHECKAPKLRPAGKQAFEDVAIKAAERPAYFDARAFLFDEPHAKVYALAEATDGGARVYEGALDASTLAPTGLVLPVHAADAAMTVDEQGTLRVFERAGRRVTIHERTAKGEERPARYVELAEGTLAFAGRRGLSIGNHASYETNDAGDTWTRVPSNGSTSGLVCGAAGCLLEGAQRVGWDLPAVQSAEIVRASSTAPSELVAKPKQPPPPPIAPVKLACKASGKGTASSDSEAEWLDGTSAVRWARLSSDYDTGAVSITWADDKAIHHTPLLAAEAALGRQVRTATDERDDGMVAARYHFAPRSATGRLNPVQVDLAWWSPAKPQLFRGTLQGVKPFRVSRGFFSGRARVVDGGVVFQGSRDDVIHFLHDDGKSETLAAPGIPFQEVWRSGKRWVLLDADDEVVELATSEDGGKSWTFHGWGLGPGPSQESYLETIGGKLAVRARGGIFEVAWPVANDPPAPAVIDAGREDSRCEGLVVGTMARREHVEGDPPVTMDLGGATFTAGARVLHDSAAGKLCTSVYVMEQGRDNEAYLYPDKGGGWSGWSYRTTDDKTMIEPFICNGGDHPAITPAPALKK